MRVTCRSIAELLLMSLAGCSYLAGNKAQARSTLKNKLDRWVSGEKGDHLMMRSTSRSVDLLTATRSSPSVPMTRGHPRTSLSSPRSHWIQEPGRGTDAESARNRVSRDDQAEDWKVVEGSRKVFYLDPKNPTSGPFLPKTNPSAGQRTPNTAEAAELP